MDSQPLLPQQQQPRRSSRTLVLTRALLIVLAILLAIIVFGSSPVMWKRHGPRKYPNDPLEHAKALLEDYPLIDGHVDLPVVARYFYQNNISSIPLAKKNETRGQVDIPRLREGRSGGFFWSVYVPCPTDEEVGKDFENAPSTRAVRDTIEQFDTVRELVSLHSNDFAMTSSAASARQAFAQGKFSGFIGLEGAHSLGNSLEVLRTLAGLYSGLNGGVGPLRYLTLTHTCNNAFADSSAVGPVWGGLSPRAPHLLYELARLGIVPDLSHTSDDTARQAMKASRGPVMWSHSSAHALFDHPRNVPDDVLKGIREMEHEKDSVIMINIYPGFVGPAKDGGKADVARVADHAEHIAKLAGHHHVGIGTDFDGILDVPRGLEDVSQYPNLIAELIRRGWTDEQLKGFVGGNVLRVLEAAERVKEEMRAEGAPVDYTRFDKVERPFF